MGFGGHGSGGGPGAVLGLGHSGQGTSGAGDTWGRGHRTVAGTRPGRGPASRGLRLSAHVSSSRAVI